MVLAPFPSFSAGYSLGTSAEEPPPFTAALVVLAEDSELIKNPVFESGILRLSVDPNVRLQGREAEACKKLLLPADEQEEQQQDENQESVTLQRRLELHAQQRKQKK